MYGMLCINILKFVVILLEFQLENCLEQLIFNVIFLELLICNMLVSKLLIYSLIVLELLILILVMVPKQKNFTNTQENDGKSRQLFYFIYCDKALKTAELASKKNVKKLKFSFLWTSVFWYSIMS